MQREEGGHRLVITNSKAHVTAVELLGHSGGSAQPRCETPLQRGAVGRHGGACPAQTPQDAIGPRGLPLLRAKKSTAGKSSNS